MDYMVGLVGIDHVGLGIDYYSTDASGYQKALADGVWKAEYYPPPPYHYPAGIDDASRLSGIAVAMAERGYADKDITKVLGGNFLRVFQQIWGA
jgi:membrane dipeptidase